MIFFFFFFFAPPGACFTNLTENEKKILVTAFPVLRSFFFIFLFLSVNSTPVVRRTDAQESGPKKEEKADLSLLHPTNKVRTILGVLQKQV